MVVSLIILAVTLALFVYRYIYWPQVYWKRRDIPQLPSVPILGNCWPTALRLKSFSEAFVDIHRGNDHKLLGLHFFTDPILLVKDPELIRQITITHFDHFVNHSKLLLNLESEPFLDKNLFNMNDDDWRRMRATLSPTFTTHKMRTMCPLMQEIADNLCEYLTKVIGSSSTGIAEIQLKDTCGRYTNDVVATAIFGLGVNSLRDVDNIFFRMGRRAATIAMWKIALNNIVGAKVLDWLNIKIWDRDAIAYLVHVFQTAMKMRREQRIVRNDMVDLLLDAQKESVEQSRVDPSVKPLTDRDLLAQTFLFFFGGYDSTSTQLCFNVLELALNPDIQQRLYEEIVTVENADGTLDYDRICHIKYLDWFILECQRKWSQAVVLDRMCTKDLDVNVNGQTQSIRKGDVLFISAYGIHQDPDIYPDPHVFDPERFTDENVKRRHACSFLGFGSGPRFCVGNPFALLSMKVLLVNCVKRFEFVTTAHTEIPIRLDVQMPQAFPNTDIVGVRVRN